MPVKLQPSVSRFRRWRIGAYRNESASNRTLLFLLARLATLSTPLEPLRHRMVCTSRRLAGRSGRLTASGPSQVGGVGQPGVEGRAYPTSTSCRGTACRPLHYYSRISSRAAQISWHGRPARAHGQDGRATLGCGSTALYHDGPSSSDGWLPAGGHNRRRSGTSLGHPPSPRKTSPHPSRFPLPAWRRGQGESA